MVQTSALNTVYISYSRCDETNQIVELLNGRLGNCNYDVKDIKEGENIKTYEEAIGQARYVIVMLNTKYLKSYHCMYELHCILNNPNKLRKVWFVNVGDWVLNHRSEVESHWSIEQRNFVADDSEVRALAERFDFYRKDRAILYNRITNYNCTNLAETGIDVFVRNIQSERDNCLFFGYNTPDYPLFGRESEVAEIRDLFHSDNYRFVNVTGMGGMGKTSLAHIYISQGNYDNVIFVTVSSDIKSEFVNSVNPYLGLSLGDFDNKYDDNLEYIKDRLSKIRGVIVFDINITDGEKLVEIGKTIRLLVPNTQQWSVLLLSRKSLENSSLIREYPLENLDFDSEKIVFANCSETDFSDSQLEELFQKLYYNPLLIEQVGLYVRKTNMTFLQIRDEIDVFTREIRLSGPVSEFSPESFVYEYLLRLISFDKLGTDEQVIMRHLIIWPSMPISLKVISTLLDGCFSVSSDLNIGLKTLVNDCYVKLHNQDYELHSLVAEVVRKQIGVVEEYDYSLYLRNVEKVIKYDYWNFLPFADCICNSLSIFSIGANCMLVFNLAYKCHKYYTNYSLSLLKILELTLLDRFDPIDNIIPQKLLGIDMLARVYNLQGICHDLYHNYNQARTNYLSAINVRSNMPNNYHNLCCLADVYVNLVKSSMDAIDCVNHDIISYYSGMAIYYYEQAETHILFEDNYDCLYGLALAYNNYAHYLHNLGVDYYERSRICYESAISFIESLNRPSYDSYILLSNVYNNLSRLENDANNYDGAIHYLDLAIDLLQNDKSYQGLIVMMRNYVSRGDVESKYVSSVAVFYYHEAVRLGQIFREKSPYNADVNELLNYSIQRIEQLGGCILRG